jgi:hypothetical protein
MAPLARATACGIKVVARSLAGMIGLNVVLLVLTGVEIWLATVWL